jgi:hypothetical protein
MDTADEERDKARIIKMEDVRALMAAQYSGPELEVSRRLAEIGIEIAQHDVEAKEAVWSQVKRDVQLGTARLKEFAPVEAEYNNARLALEKARLELKRFDFATARHQQINAVVETYIRLEKTVSGGK